MQLKSLVFSAIMVAVSACSGSSNPAPNGAAAQPPTSNPPGTREGFQTVSKARVFDFPAGRGVPMDFQSMKLDWNFDVTAQETIGRAEIVFEAPEAGKPYFLLGGTIRSSRLNGNPVSVASAPNPIGDQIQYIDAEIPANRVQTLTLEYAMNPDSISYRTGGVGFVTAMADITQGNFFESYGPTSFEDDQFKMTLNLSMSGATHSHQLFTNGSPSQVNGNAWSIEFPDFFTTSSFYLHVTDAALAVRQTTYPGVEKTIPVTVYAADEASAASAIDAVPGLLRELENDYGPYLHPSFTAYISGSGGMEHNGATITSVDAIGHELTHSWFGRGVMPSNGSSGWVDEAIATWRDRGYPSNLTEASLSPANIGNLSPFERFTPFLAYNQGGELMTVLDNLFTGRGIQGGLKSVLKDFFAQFKTKLITTDQFQGFLETRSGTSMNEIFSNYVLGRQAAGTVGGDIPPSQPGAGGAPIGTKHPPALTPDEVSRLR